MSKIEQDYVTKKSSTPTPLSTRRGTYGLKKHSFSRSSSMEIVNKLKNRRSSYTENNDNQKFDYENVSIFNCPLLSGRVLLICLSDLLMSALGFVKDKIVPMLIITTAMLFFLYGPGPHEEVSVVSLFHC